MVEFQTQKNIGVKNGVHLQKGGVKINNGWNHLQGGPHSHPAVTYRCVTSSMPKKIFFGRDGWFSERISVNRFLVIWNILTFSKTLSHLKSLDLFLAILQHPCFFVDLKVKLSDYDKLFQKQKQFKTKTFAKWHSSELFITLQWIRSWK